MWGSEWVSKSKCEEVRVCPCVCVCGVWYIIPEYLLSGMAGSDPPL